MRHLLSTRDLDRDTAIGILDVAEDMADVARRAVPKLTASLIGMTSSTTAGS